MPVLEAPAAVPAEAEADTLSDAAAAAAAPAAEPEPAPAPPFLEALPPEMTEGVRLPLLYRMASAVSYQGQAPMMRAAESAHHHTTMLACLPFYKPVSRCVGGRG